MSIKEIQKLLKQLGYYKGKIDGIKGAQTKSATKKFQKKYKLAIDGIPGAKTQAKLKSLTKTKKKPAPNKKPLTKRIIYISAGHGGRDPGAVKGKWKEKNLNLDIAKACNSHLKAEGYNTMMARITDREVGINTRVNQANRAGAIVYVSIHNNAGGGDGYLAIRHPKSSKAKVLTGCVKSQVKKIGQNIRNDIVRDRDGEVRLTNMPAIINECAFVDNAKDMKILDTAAKRKKMGEAIAKGVIEYLKTL